MNKKILVVATLIGTLGFAQEKQDTIAVKEVEAVTITARKPTVETKVDRTVFNVENSSVLAGNTTWDVLRMTPLVSIDNNDAVKSEGQNVTVYINDRKSVFTGKELKEYLKSIPAENLMKIEVITNPSSRYETTGQVINIVLKKRDDEGVKGSVTLTNTQQSKNNQYSNFNLNYHKNKFTQTLTGSFSDNKNVTKALSENTIFADNSLTAINTNGLYRGQMPSFSSTSEVELNDKNNLGVIFEFFQNKSTSTSDASAERFVDDVLTNSYLQNQHQNGRYTSLGSSVFYKFYDKTKNKIFDVNAGINYNSENNINSFEKIQQIAPQNSYTQIFELPENRNYYLKLDYSQPIDTLGSSIEFGAKMDFHNNVRPNRYEDLYSPANNYNSYFQYTDNINSVYGNFSTKFFKKLETRIGLRYEYITYKIHQRVGDVSREREYGRLLPNILLKYTFSPNFNLSTSYNYSLWRPWFSEFDPFLVPSEDGNYYRGNMDLEPNPNHRFTFKVGMYKKYFLSLNYSYTDQDYWSTYRQDGQNLIIMPDNFYGRSERYSAYFNTNQTFLKNKLSVNLNLGVEYMDNSDFNERNNLNSKNYMSNFSGSGNVSYSNIFDKNINFTGWVGVYTQNYGNNVGNQANVFHNFSVTKIFPVLGMETSLQFNNIFKKPQFDRTTYSPIGTFRSNFISDWHGVSLTFIKRFGNQKVKENTKTDLEKSEGGKK